MRTLQRKVLEKRKPLYDLTMEEVLQVANRIDLQLPLVTKNKFRVVAWRTAMCSVNTPIELGLVMMAYIRRENVGAITEEPVSIPLKIFMDQHCKDKYWEDPQLFDTLKDQILNNLYQIDSMHIDDHTREMIDLINVRIITVITCLRDVLHQEVEYDVSKRS